MQTQRTYTSTHTDREQLNQKFNIKYALVISFYLLFFLVGVTHCIKLHRLTERDQQQQSYLRKLHKSDEILSDFKYFEARQSLSSRDTH